MVGGNGNRSDDVASCDHLHNVAGSNYKIWRQNALILALIQRRAGLWLFSALEIQQVLLLNRCKR